MSEQFRTFASNLLEANGALVSTVEPLGLEVILPARLQQTLDLPEHGVLAFSGEVPNGWRRVVLESDWMDRFGTLLADHGHKARLCLTAAAVTTPARPERILEHRLRLNNAVYRLQSVKEIWTRCLLHTFRYSAMSDEKRDGLVLVGRNLSTGGVLDPWVESILQVARLEHAGVNQEVDSEEDRFPSGSCPEFHTHKETERLTLLVPSLVRLHLNPFLHGMQRRQQRDLDRLHHYHTDLRKEISSRLASAVKKGEEKLEEERQRSALRLDSITREYHAKIKDLYEKYALTVHVAWVQSLLLDVRVFRFHLLIKRRKGERSLYLDWHPAIRQLEDPPCEAGLPSGAERTICDDALHVVSINGFAPCAGCDKPFCRACHPDHCPRCHRRWREL